MVEATTSGIANRKGLDPKLIKLISQILNEFVTKMSVSFRDEAEKFVEEDTEIANELIHASETFHSQASDAIEMIADGELTLSDMRRVSGTLYLTNLSLRWVLEQQTVTYRKLLAEAPDNLGSKIERARLLIETGAVEEGFRDLLALVEHHREFYPLLMTMGFVYLKVKKNLAYAMRYFEKAAKTPPRLESSHYRSLALHFLATCHEGQQRYKNALNTLLLAEKKHLADVSLQYSISRLYAYLNESASSMLYFEKVLKAHPAFYAIALVDPAYESIHLDLKAKVKEYSVLFHGFTDQFSSEIETVMMTVEAYDLQHVNPTLKRDVERLAALLPLIGKRCFSGYRTAIIRFFMGLYPEVLQDLQAVIMKRQKETLHEMRLRQISSIKKRRRLRLILSPLSVLATVVPIYLFQTPLLSVSPIRFPFDEFVLPILGGGLGLWIVLAILAGKGNAGVHEMVTLKALESSRRSLAETEKRLGVFWKEQVASYVDEVPVWI